jgi:hypothetical protein
MSVWQVIRWFLWLPDPKPRRKTLWQELEEMAPGEVMILTDDRNGMQYAVQHLDDFDHVAELCNLRRREPTS